MDFQDVPARRRRIRASDHMAVAAAVALTLILFGGAEDFDRGRAEVSDAAGFSIVFVLVGYFIGWTPASRADGRPSRIEPFLTPTFMGLILVYLYSTFQAGYIQPWATGCAVVIQMIALVYLGLRTS